MNSPTTDGSSAPGSSSSFADWSGSLDRGFTGLGCRLFAHGRYHLDERCGGKSLEHRRTDFNPTLFTIDVVDAPGGGKDWIILSGDFAAADTIKEVIVDDGEEQFRFAVDRSRIDGAGASARRAAEEEKTGIPCPFAGNKDWYSSRDSMGIEQPVLRLTGMVEVGSDGYVGRLTSAEVQESMPPNQVYELTLVESRCGKAGWQEVRSETPAEHEKYGLAIIRCHGEELASAEVQEVV